MKVIKKQIDSAIIGNEEEYHKNKKSLSILKYFRASTVALLFFTFICGIIYPITCVILGQSLFPWEANGSKLGYLDEYGVEHIVGSELIGQQYDNPNYLFGRVNSGVSNLNPNSDEYYELIKNRQEALIEAGIFDENDQIPDELLTNSGSGVDPHISKYVADLQVESIVKHRNESGWKLLKEGNEIIDVIAPKDVKSFKEEDIIDFNENFVNEVISTYTEGRFLGIFGTDMVNVLKVNLTLDGINFYKVY